MKASFRIPPALLLLCTAVCLPAVGSEDEDGELVVIRARRVITISGRTYAPGMVVIENGSVRAVGQKLDYPATARVLDARRETVMPGLILPRTRHGLGRYSRSGLHGKEKAVDEVFLSEIDFDGLLEAGYTAVAYIPEGTGIPGVASVIHTGGPRGPQLIEERSYLRVTMTNPPRDKPELRRALATAKKEIEKVRKAREEWEKKRKEATEKTDQQKKGSEAKEPEEGPPQRKPPEGKEAEKEPAPADGNGKPPEPAAAFTPPEIDPNVQPLVDLIEEKPGASVVFELARASDLHHLDDVLKEYSQIRGRYYLSLDQTDDYHHVAALLGERKALLTLPPLLSTIPYTVNDTNLAASLARAGCQIVFVPRRDDEGEYRYIRTRVAEVVRSGLTRDTALEALTLNAARLLGLEARYGSIEKGKAADLIFLNGDPLGPERRVTRVMIGGEIVWRDSR